MPIIPSDQINATVILLNKGLSPVGTAFIARYADVTTMTRGYYLITCDHCVKSTVVARFCNDDMMTLTPSEWQKHPNGDDVVAFDITDFVDQRLGLIEYIDFGLFVEPDEDQFIIGVDVYMLGLLIDEQDTGHNRIRARFGNLSSFAHSSDKIKQGNDHVGPCHIADMRSRTGFSGSPVFGYIETTALNSRPLASYRLMGIHSAQQRERIDVYSHSAWSAAEVHSGMTRIVPSWAMKDLIINDTLFISKRQSRPPGLV